MEEQQEVKAGSDVVDGSFSAQNQQTKLLPTIITPYDVNKKILSEERIKLAKRNILLQKHRIHLTSLPWPPETVWLYILRKLDIDNRENMAEASPYFEHLLRKSLVLEFLFPRVFEVLANKYEANRIYWNCANETEKKQEAKAWARTALRCRLVCKSWNQSVERCYQKRYMSGIPENKRKRDPRLRSTPKYDFWTANNYYITNLEEVQEFLDHFGGTHLGKFKKNPFFGRYVNFGDENPDKPDPKFHHAVSNIVDNWGDDIWYCSLRVIREEDERARIVWLKNFLGNMPNLKYLHLTGACHRKATQALLEANQLPTLLNLVEIRLFDVDAVTAGEILRRNSHIKYLNMQLLKDFDENASRSLTKLKGLIFQNITFLLGRRGFYFSRRFENLSKLTISTEENYCTGQEVFRSLEKHCSGLTDLKIKNFCVSRWEDPSLLEFTQTFRLQLPRLRCFHLSMRNLETIYLDFLLSTTKSLEHIRINKKLHSDLAERSETYERVIKTQIVQFNGYETRMGESNIWLLFPKLETIAFVRGNELPKLLFSKSVRQ